MSMDDDLFNVNNGDDMLEEDDNFDMDVDTQENNAGDNDDDNAGENDDDNMDDNDDENQDDNGDNDDENDDENDEVDNEDTDMGTNGTVDSGESTQKDPDNADGTRVDVGARSLRERVLDSIRKASEFDIIPIVAIPYSQPCHAMALSEGPKWILTGGEDGFIRKYDFCASIEGKAPLTVAQKHNLMDSITKAGVIGLYWENEQPMTRKQMMTAYPKIKESDFNGGSMMYEPQVSPVYSLAVERNGFWCVSGLRSGGILLYTMIYNEGGLHHYFAHGKNSGHLDAVSVLKLNRTNDRMLLGLWDKSIREWDLNLGKVVSVFSGSTGQISSIEHRPVGLAEMVLDRPPETTADNHGSDDDSLFGSDHEDDRTNKPLLSDAVFMSSSIDGTINIWDARASGKSVLRLGVPENVPPWCMAARWANDGDKLYVGRRNSTVEEISLRMPHTSAPGKTRVPNVSKKLVFPRISGPVSALATMPNDRFLLCGCNDNIRLYDLTDGDKRATPFFVIPGHNGGMLSHLHVDPTGRFMVSTSGNRGWGHLSYADVVLVYSIDCEGMP